MSTLGQRLRKSRNLRGYNQSELAKQSDVSQQLISRIENGKIESTTEIFSLANALNINSKWLATGEGDMEPITMNPSDASEDEIRFLHLLRCLTSWQREDAIKNLEKIKQQNEQIIQELSTDKTHP